MPVATDFFLKAVKLSFQTKTGQEHSLLCSVGWKMSMESLFGLWREPCDKCRLKIPTH